MKTIDTFLSIIQKILVIAAALVAGWFVLVRKDNSIHSQISITGTLGKDCVLTSRVQVRNPKGLILEPLSLAIQVYDLDLGDNITVPNNSLRLAEQVRVFQGKAKVGEDISMVLATKLAATSIHHSFVRLRAQMTLKGNTIYSDEIYVETEKCRKT